MSKIQFIVFKIIKSRYEITLTTFKCELLLNQQPVGSYFTGGISHDGRSQ